MTDTEVQLDASRKTIEIRRFSTGVHEILTPKSGGGTYAGGDSAIMENFADAILTGQTGLVLPSVADSLDSHLLAFAAGESRRNHQAVDLADFEKKIGDARD